MFAILKKDFFSLFNNVVGFIFIAVNMAFYGLYFLANNLLSGSPSISATLGGVLLIMLITTPLLTMRTFTEERKNKTDVLLLTSPVSVSRMIIGKYLAMVLAFSINTVLIALSIFFLRIFGKVSFKESFVALLGFWLFGCVCLAIGTFVSSLFESQVLAAIITEGVLLLAYMMSAITGMSKSGNFVTKILGSFDILSPYNNFGNGMIYLSSVVYDLSLVFLFLFLTAEVILKRRWTISRKKILTSTFSLTAIVLCFAMVILANVGITKIPEAYQTLDLSSNKYYSLTKATKKYLKNLDSDVTIYCLSTKDKCDVAVRHTLSLFNANKHISVQYIDPDLNPTFANKYTKESLSEGSLIFENTDNQNTDTCPYYMLYSNSNDSYTLYSYAQQSGASYDKVYVQTADGYDAEGQILSRLQMVNSAEIKKVYQLAGHSEVELGKAETNYLSKKNLTLDTLNLRTDAIPDDCCLLILNGPVSDIGTDELDLIRDYLKKGGKMLLTMNPDSITSADGTPNLNAFLTEYGLTPTAGIVEDLDSSYRNSQNNYFLYPDLTSASHLTDSIATKPSVLVPYAIGFRLPTDDNSIAVSFLNTSDTVKIASVEDATAAYNNNENSDESSPADLDTQGRVSLGAAVSTNNDGKNNLVVLSSCYMFLDNVEQIAPGMNSALFGNIVSNSIVSSDDSDAIVVAPKPYNATVLQFTALQVGVFAVVWIALIPLALLVFGITIWVVRKRR